jgi:hypothetical protein
LEAAGELCCCCNGIVLIDWCDTTGSSGVCGGEVGVLS